MTDIWAWRSHIPPIVTWPAGGSNVVMEDAGSYVRTIETDPTGWAREVHRCGDWEIGDQWARCGRRWRDGNPCGMFYQIDHIPHEALSERVYPPEAS